MSRIRRCLALFAAAAALASCGGDSVAGSGDKKRNRTAFPSVTQTAVPVPTKGLPPCNKPKEVRYPDWVPEDLPLPAGAYAYQNLPPVGGYERALFVLETDTQRLTKFVLKRWPEEGWTLGRGDAEPGEVEDDFHKPPAVGGFKANDVFCDPGYTVMYLIYAPKGPKGLNVLPSPTSKGTPLKS